MNPRDHREVERLVRTGMGNGVSRREFLRAGAAVPVAVSAAALGVSCGEDPEAAVVKGGEHAEPNGSGRNTPEPAGRPTTGDGALNRLMEGNRRYADSEEIHPDQSRARLERLAEDQRPFATVIACSDSRLSPELLFDQGVGDLFVIRVVGNIVDQAVLGSVEYAVWELGTPLVMMLGHEACGGVTAAVESVEKGAGGGRGLPGHILTFADAIYPAVVRAKASSEGDPEADLIDAAVRENARINAARLGDDLEFLSAAGEDGRTKVVGAYYDLHNRRVSLL